MGMRGDEASDGQGRLDLKYGDGEERIEEV